MFRLARIFILLLILAGVAWGSWQARSRSVEWKYSLPVNIYPVNADASPATAEYIRHLRLSDFTPVESYMKKEAARYGRESYASVEIRLGGVIDATPPAPPESGNMLAAMGWSLRMRWWAYRHAKTRGAGPQVRLFLLYFDPARTHKLHHSTGLQKGLLGRVNVFASAEMSGQNNVVITHEFLHTLGATDKYDVMTNQPLFPHGYVMPAQVPILPQQFAEIMAGRIPVSQSVAEIPDSLEQTRIGEQTAREIKWLDK